MSAGGARRLQFAAACGLLAAYAGLSHYCNATRSAGLGAALALSPLSMISVALLWRTLPAPAALCSSTLLAAGAVIAWPLLERNFTRLYMAQETLAYGLLGLTFGRSLLGRRTALCTRLADRVHGPLSAREIGYTRRVTAAWAVFFGVIAALSIVLYAAAPLAAWSIYINFCVVPLVGVMFLAEYTIRRRVLPQVKTSSLLATVRVYFAGP